MRHYDFDYTAIPEKQYESHIPTPYHTDGSVTAVGYSLIVVLDGGERQVSFTYCSMQTGTYNISLVYCTVDSPIVSKFMKDLTLEQFENVKDNWVTNFPQEAQAIIKRISF